MTSTPNFERDEDHDYQPREEVYVIDNDGYDIYEAVIVNVEGFRYTVHYPEYPNDDEVLDGTSRLLPKTRVNTRIYRNQEVVRSEKSIKDLGSNSSSDDDDEKFDDDADQDFKPNQSPEVKSKKKGKKDKKEKKAPKKKGPSFVPRPQGARTNPPRGQIKHYVEYDTDSE